MSPIGVENPYQANIMGLTIWKTEQPGYSEWKKYMGMEGKSAERMTAGLLKTAVFEICQHTQEQIPDVCQDIMNGNEEVLHGICDLYHIADLEALKFIKHYLDTPKSKINTILDYYGKTGEFTYRVVKSTNCKATYIDQNPWSNYAKFRFRMKGINYDVRALEATAQKPRPELGARYGFIMSPDLPIDPTAASEDGSTYMDWLSRHIIPYGLILTSADMDLKLVAKVPYSNYKVFQAVP